MGSEVGEVYVDRSLSRPLNGYVFDKQLEEGLARIVCHNLVIQCPGIQNVFHARKLTRRQRQPRGRGILNFMLCISL